jgi:hypothetical protein
VEAFLIGVLRKDDNRGFGQMRVRAHLVPSRGCSEALGSDERIGFSGLSLLLRHHKKGT